MGFINGSDALIKVAGNFVGHSTTHTTTYNTETKDRAFKPVGSEAKGDGLWSKKSISKLSISVSIEGLRCDDETENGYAMLLAAWKEAKEVEVIALERGNATKPYLEGNFIITSIEESSPAEDDATYSISLESSGSPKTFEPENLSDYVKATT
jgi:predicted secreted protein